jgi:hypothetical protein
MIAGFAGSPLEDHHDVSERRVLSSLGRRRSHDVATILWAV